VKTQKAFPVVAIGDPVKASIKMYNKYRKELE
jgi:hypothetical protein